MKLNSKKEVVVQKSNERKREIEEGKKLALSVDSLRETHSKEQQSLKKFRDETLALIKIEIDASIKEKEKLVQDLLFLKEEKLKAQAPLDLAEEWKSVEKLKEDVSQREMKVITREILVQNLDQREKQVEEKEKNAQKYLDSTKTSYYKADLLREEIENKKKESDAEITAKNEFLIEQEKDLYVREILIKQEKEEIERLKKEFLERGNDLIQREIRVDAQSKIQFEKDIQIKEKEALTAQYNDEASKNYDKSEITKLETLKAKDNAENDIRERYLKLSEKELEFGYRERDLLLVKENVENERRLIEKEKIHISSQQQSLRVAWENIKKLQANQ